MVQAAEQEFQQGLAQYKSGHLSAAKSHFDQAMAAMMRGPVDIQSDDRLRREFDKIVDQVHELEMQALKQGDGFSEQNAEPAPIDEANDTLTPVDPGVKAKAEQELQATRSDIPLVINDYVASYINFFTNTTRGRNTLINGWQRAGRYREMIFRILKEEGVPQDLFYLAQAESGFHALAVSRVGARGMWQFMHYTAPLYGLERTWWVDDRQDPEKATRAAARHLKDLYNQFGDWWLAMAAYNSGAGNVQRAVQRTGYADFWELYKRNALPAETKNYVPIIVAMTIVAKNPTQYGLNEVGTEPPQEPDTVTTNYAVDLRLVAEATDSTLDEVADLNPALLRRVTPRDQEYELKLPHGTKEKFAQAIAAIPADKRVLWRYHHVADGETLDSIAKKYHVTSSAIRQVNDLEGDDLAVDSRLVIPVSGRASASAQTAYAKHPKRYKVRRGDTLTSVADDFGVPAERLKRWNHLKSNSLRVGRTLVIYPPVSADPDPPVRKAKKPSAKKLSVVTRKTSATAKKKSTGTTKTAKR